MRSWSTNSLKWWRKCLRTVFPGISSTLLEFHVAVHRASFPWIRPGSTNQPNNRNRLNSAAVIGTHSLCYYFECFYYLMLLFFISVLVFVNEWNTMYFFLSQFHLTWPLKRNVVSQSLLHCFIVLESNLSSGYSSFVSIPVLPREFLSIAFDHGALLIWRLWSLDCS